MKDKCYAFKMITFKFNRMRDLLDRNVHSIILTSGTLSPLAATITEIGIPIQVQLQNAHVIKDNQASFIKIIIISL